MNIEKTEDGSCTLFIPEINEHYHSTKGALTESKHIFIDKGLNHCVKEDINLLEIGFGTGLNAILTLIESNNSKRKIHYSSIEKYPLDMDTIENLNYSSFLNEEEIYLYYNIHKAPWNQYVKISPYFFINKIKDDFTLYNFSEKYDIIYFDAFAPEKQPEMWKQELFDSLYNSLNENGILTTYCAKGIIRRMLQSAGFIVERLEGPPNGKREILRATKKEKI